MRRHKVLTHERFAKAPVQLGVHRELTAIREVLHAFLSADRLEEVFQFALDRTTPLIGAAFASVYLVDGASELMRLAATHNWPVKYRPWLGEMRVRIGFGPSGEAVSERRIIEVPDVGVGQGLEDWAEVAAELGFKSLVALPLSAGTRALGAVTYYFTTAGTATPESRDLMRVVADLLAASAEKLLRVSALRRSDAALSDLNAEYERVIATSRTAERSKDEFLASLTDDLRVPLETLLPILDRHADADPELAKARDAAGSLRWRIYELLEYASLRSGSVPLNVERFAAVEAIDAAVSMLRASTKAHSPSGQEVREIVVSTDRRKVARIVACLISAIDRNAPGADVELMVSRSPVGGVEYKISARRIDGSTRLRIQDVNAGVGVPLATLLAQFLSGGVQTETGGGGIAFSVHIPDLNGQPS